MLQRVKEVQESDLRMDGTLAHNIQRVIAVTQADIDTAAAQGKSWVVKPVVKVSDPLDNLRGGTQLVIKQNAILPGQNVMRVMYVGGQAVVVGPGTSPLSLPDATDNDILSLIAFGGTMQGVPDGYTLLDGITNGANTAVATGIQPTVDDVEWEVRIKPTTDSWYILQARTGGQSIWGISGSTTGSTILLGWNGNQSLLQSGITRNATHTYYVKATAKNGVATLYVKDETEGTEDTQTTTYTFNAGQLPSSQFYLFANGNPQYVSAGNTIYMARIKVGGVTVMDYVPALNPSNVVGFYDKVTGNFVVSSAGTLTADQTVVPTPTAPIDITCNNGVLKVDNQGNIYTDGTVETIAVKSKNILDPSPYSAYKQSDGTYRLTASNANSVRIYFTSDMIGKTYTFSVYFDLTKESGPTAVKTGANINGSGVPGNNIVDGTKGYSYVTMTPTSTNDYLYITYGSGSNKYFTMSELQLELGSNRTDYIAYNNSVATAEMLLSAGDYTDEQEIVSGAITRKCGVLVFDGTETFWKDQIPNNSRVFIRNYDINCISVSNRYEDYFCSHFLATAISSPSAGSTAITSSGLFFWVPSGITTLTQWTDWLAAQYAAGTPVIVVYPLETPTTETVTGQPMSTVAGDNTAEITQAGMAGLELEAEYQKVN